MDSPLRKLNPLLRLAAISGVETAIKLHIHRGDDLDARDGSGATPLILAAGRRRRGAVRLLLEAGADPLLADRSGMDALAHALKGGCPETIAILKETVARIAAAEPAPEPVHELFTGVENPGVEALESVTRVEPAADEPPISDVGVQIAFSPDDQPPMASVESVHGVAGIPSLPRNELLSTEEHGVVTLDDEPLDTSFADDWEAEEEVTAPAGDESVAEAARQIHESIGHHKAQDRDEDWGDVDLHLPDRAAPLARDEDGGAVRDLLLAALREGMIPEERLIDVCSNADGSRNEEAEKILAIIVGELGATVVEWTGSDDAPFMSDTSMEEDLILTEASEFVEDLASGRNDPFRFFAKGIHGVLLDAKEEIALAREMEDAGRAALSALASWPEGLSAVFDAAGRVATGEADAESFTTGPDSSSVEETVSRPVVAMENEDDETRLDEGAVFFVNAIAAVKAFRGDACKVVKALEEARLTRGFLTELADKGGATQIRRDFAEALARQTKARERMILSNLRLALSIAKKHLWSGVPFDDLVQEANIGLMKAVERYDWRKGFRFSTYATWWIRQQVSRSIADTDRVVRAPVHVQETARKVLRERKAVEARLGRPETEAETARRIGIPLAKTQMLLGMFADVASLDEVDPDSGLSRADVLIDEAAPGPEDVVERASLRMVLLGMLEDLDERERKVILLRFGFMDGEAMTLEEVGQHFGVTRERIRQIESKAMRKLSVPYRRQILLPFMGEGHGPTCAPSPAPAGDGSSSQPMKESLHAEDVHEIPQSVAERDAR